MREDVHFFERSIKCAVSFVIFGSSIKLLFNQLSQTDILRYRKAKTIFQLSGGCLPTSRWNAEMVIVDR